MSLRVSLIWGNAAWREAVRLREAFIDVDHLLLGLVAAGGPAARLLGRHGFTLASGRRAALRRHAGALASLGVDVTSLPPVTPLPVDDLHQGAAGYAPTTARAKRLCNSTLFPSDERRYLTALLAEPSGTVGEVLECAGVDVDALARDVDGSSIDWHTPTPRRVASSTPARRGHHISSLRLEHWISAPLHVVYDVAAGLEETDRWMTSPDGRLRVVDGRHQARVDTGISGATRTRDLVLACATPDQVSWQMWWGACYGGSHTVDLQPVEGGTLTVLTRELVTFRRLGAVVMPPVRFAPGLGMPIMIQNLSFACADLLDREQS